MTVEQLDLTKLTTLDDAFKVIKWLIAENLKLQTENQALRVEVNHLREEVARLSKNSRNSSKPPSSDIVKPKSEQRQPGKRKQGGQTEQPPLKTLTREIHELTQHVNEYVLK